MIAPSWTILRTKPPTGSRAARVGVSWGGADIAVRERKSDRGSIRARRVGSVASPLRPVNDAGGV